MKADDGEEEEVLERKKECLGEESSVGGEMSQKIFLT